MVFSSTIDHVNFNKNNFLLSVSKPFLMYLKSFIISENQKITPLFKCAKSDYKYQWALEIVHFDIG